MQTHLLQKAILSQSVLRGMEIAQQHCSRCHVVSDNNRFSDIETTPSFLG